jgi:hypothetical protein
MQYAVLLDSSSHLEFGSNGMAPGGEKIIAITTNSPGVENKVSNRAKIIKITKSGMTRT